MKILSILLAGLPLLSAANLVSAADAAKGAAKLESVKKELAGPNYLLRYKFSEGETVRSKVVHVAATETKIQGNTQIAKMRSVSTKVWNITGVDAQGNTTLVYSVEKLDMWQHVSDRSEIRYRSDSGDKPPAEYEAAAKTVGVPLTTAVIDAHGRVLKRESKLGDYHFGVGQIVPPLPEERVKVGHVWYIPADIRIRLPGGEVKLIKTREKYTLEKVETGVATVAVATEVLTPVNDAKVKSQLVQQLTRGVIKFDLDSGRIRSKKLDWDETVIGFNGADSIMQYVAEFTEELLAGGAGEQPTTASTAVKSGGLAPAGAGRSDTKPSSRRR